MIANLAQFKLLLEDIKKVAWDVRKERQA